jgi:shikimate kinase
MNNVNIRDKSIVLTGFMGVGKSSVARHLSRLLKVEMIDLDEYIETSAGRKISAIIDHEGEEFYRRIETDALAKVLDSLSARVLSLGGGTWISEHNRNLIREKGLTSIWLESPFDHCWQNIRKSRKERPLARDREAALRLFESRQSLYCLADWHFIVKPDLTSYEVASQIVDEVF